MRFPRPRRRRLVLIVRLSSDRARRAVHQDCSFAKKQESASARLVVVPSERLVATDWDAGHPWETGRGVP